MSLNPNTFVVILVYVITFFPCFVYSQLFIFAIAASHGDLSEYYNTAIIW